MKKRFGKAKYSEKAIDTEDIFRFKTTHRQHNYKCPEIKKAMDLLLKEYVEEALINPLGVRLSASMGVISIKFTQSLNDNPDRKMISESGITGIEHMNFGTNGKLAKVVWERGEILSSNIFANFLRFESHTTFSQKAHKAIVDNPYKYKIAKYVFKDN